MRMNILAFVLLAIGSLCFSAAYTGIYTEGWVKVIRNTVVTEPSGCAGAVTGACSNTGAQIKGNGYSTYANLTIENVGSVDRSSVEVKESLAYVPSGAKISFYPLPSSTDGSSAVWNIGSLAQGEKKAVAYSFPARISETAAAGMPQPSVTAPPAQIQVFAPSSAQIGDRVSIALMTMSGKMLPGIIVTLEYPDGTSHEIRSDYLGKVSYTAEREGFITYSVRGYSLARVVSTGVQAKEEAPLVAAAATGMDAGIASILSGLLPVLAAIFGLAVLALLIYNFFNSRSEDEQHTDAPPEQQYYHSPQPAVAQPTYTQKYTFTSEPQPQQDMADITRNLVESRKKQMQAPSVAPAEPQLNEQRTYQGKPVEPEQKETAQKIDFRGRAGAEGQNEDELEQELEKLEGKAEEEGEVTEEEDEIEKAIAELEEIRKKLRERRDQVLELGKELEQEGPDDRKGGTQGSRPKPRVMPPTERVQPFAQPLRKK